MTCSHCNAELEVDAKKCRICGAWAVHTSRPNAGFSTDTSVKCPYCHGEINIGATKCRHCGEWLSQAAQMNDHGNKLMARGIVNLIVGLLLTAFVLFALTAYFKTQSGSRELRAIIRAAK